MYVALKKLEVPKGTSSAVLERTLSDFLSEAKMLRRVGHHPCINSMVGTFEFPLCLLMEYCANGNLFEAVSCDTWRVDKTGGIPWPLKRRMAHQIASGVHFLHTQEPAILHRDLKSLNILLDDQWNAKVSDFGLSRFGATSVFDRMTGQCGTWMWMAPEVMTAMDGLIYGPGVDVFSFAVVVWEIATQLIPFDGWQPPQVIAAVAHRGDRLPLPPVSVACPRPFLELIVRCWAQVPDHRPSFGEIVACLEAMPQVMPEGDVTPDAPQG